MYLADTSFLIDLTKDDDEAKRLAVQLDQEKMLVSISTVTVEEFLRGVYYLFSDQPDMLPRRLHRAEADLQRFDIVDLTYQIARTAARLDAELTRQGQQVGFADVLIAATAIDLGFQLITRNIDHFERIPSLRLRTY